MAGGIGSRFWPLSTPDYPKQFIDILGCGKTLIQLTVDRFIGVCPLENIWVVTNTKYVGIVKEQIPGILDKHILAEPVARNTAPCIAWACWKIKSEDPYANVVVTPSDAIVMNTEEFRRVIKNALDFTAENDAIVTIGIRPNRPETGYGYVKIDNKDGGEICAVDTFKEKPDYATAQQYLADGNYLWNAGIFVWNVKTIVDTISKYHSQIAGLMNRIAQSFGMTNEPDTTEGLFPLCEKISIDYAVMEPASRDGKVFTLPSDFGWSDLGNWASLYEKLPRDGSGNAVVGAARLFDCSDCIVLVEDTAGVVIEGLDGYIVSAKDGNILVCERSKEQSIKEYLAN